MHTLGSDAYFLHPTFTAHLSRPKHAWLSHLCTAMQDRAIKLWNPHKGNLIKTYNGVLQQRQAFLPLQRMYLTNALYHAKDVSRAGHGYDVRDAVVSSDNSKYASPFHDCPTFCCSGPSLICTGIAGLACTVWAWLAVYAQAMQGSTFLDMLILL